MAILKRKDHVMLCQYDYDEKYPQCVVHEKKWVHFYCVKVKKKMIFLNCICKQTNKC